MKIENVAWVARDMQFDTMLWDTYADPEQQTTLQNADIGERLRSQMITLMKEADSPVEQFNRLQL